MSESKNFADIELGKDIAISSEEKSAGIITYLTIIGLIIGFVQNSSLKSEYVNFHIRQMIGLVCIMVASSIIAVIPILGWIVYLVGLIGGIVLWVMAIMGASNGEKKPVPLLGKQFQQWFASIKA